MKPISFRGAKDGVTAHLDDDQLQSLADGSLRGPEGAKAREHTDACAECAEAASVYRGLIGGLDALVDPAPPPDFTQSVMEAVSLHQESLAARRHIYLATIPAVLVASLAVIGWVFSASPDRRLTELLRGFTAARTVWEVARPAIEAGRLQLMGAALLVCLALGAMLLRALRLPAPASDVAR